MTVPRSVNSQNPCTDFDFNEQLNSGPLLFRFSILFFVYKVLESPELEIQGLVVVSGKATFSREREHRVEEIKEAGSGVRSRRRVVT